MTSLIAIIGAGIGGLSAAISLAARGQRVAVYEQLSRPGGKMGELREAGFRWDTGPSVITMRHVFERLFRQAGRDFNDYVELLPLNPITRYFWRDGLVLDAVADEEAMCAQIREFAPKDVDSYRRFLRYAHQLHDLIAEPFLYRGQPGLKDIFSLPVRDVFRIDALRTMHQAVQSHFHDPHLIQLFDRFATYNGSSPYKAPATLNVIAHVEMGMGAWYPRGGVYAIAQAMARLASELGVDLRYNSPVQAITTQNGKATGVRLVGEVQIDADAVIANADVTHTYNHLLPPSNAKKHWLEPSCSGYVLCLGIRRRSKVGVKPWALVHHNILFSDDYPREFDDIFKRKVPTHDPTVYICNTSATDLDHAPTYCANWFVLINVPYLSAAYDWETQAGHYGSTIKAILAERIGLSSEDIVVERQFTPLDLQRTYGGHQGAIYGFSSNTKLAAFRRPNNRASAIKRLYFASGSAHPGGGVPLVTLSGMAAARNVIDDLR